MREALQGKIPDKKFKHSPLIQNDNLQTVALILAE